jgi:hypothetical protein
VIDVARVDSCLGKSDAPSGEPAPRPTALSRVKRWLREPLLHFLLLGAGLFVAFGLVGKRTSGEPGKIVITQGQIEHLAAGYNRVHGRPAAPEEWEG